MYIIYLLTRLPTPPLPSPSLPPSLLSLPPQGCVWSVGVNRNTSTAVSETHTRCGTHHPLTADWSFHMPVSLLPQHIKPHMALSSHSIVPVLPQLCTHVHMYTLEGSLILKDLPQETTSHNTHKSYNIYSAMLKYLCMI